MNEMRKLMEQMDQLDEASWDSPEYELAHRLEENLEELMTSVSADVAALADIPNMGRYADEMEHHLDKLRHATWKAIDKLKGDNQGE